MWERWETATWQWVKNLFPCWRLATFLTMGIDPSHLFRMTFYRLIQGSWIRLPKGARWRTQCDWRHSLVVMTQIVKEYLACSWQLTADGFYPHTGFPHHVYSSFVRFRITINVFCHCGAFPLIVIQSFGKNTLRERWKPAMCHKAKNLLLGWHLAVFLTTAADPSLARWMTISVSCHYDDFFRHPGNAGKTVRMICTGARLFPK